MEKIAVTRIDGLSPRVLTVNGVPMATSLAIAEHFEKDHKHVLRAIRLEIEQQDDPEFSARHFIASEHIDARGKGQPIFRLSELGFSLIAMGFTGARASRWKRAYAETFRVMREAILVNCRLQSEQLQTSFDEPHGQIHELRLHVERLEIAAASAPASEGENRATVLKHLFKARKDLLVNREIKTRYVVDQHRVSSAETALRLAYATTASEAAVLWLLLQAGAGSAQVSVSIQAMLKRLRPHIKAESTIVQARNRLVARGLLSLLPHCVSNRAIGYAIHTDRVLLLLQAYDAQWLRATGGHGHAGQTVPGLTDKNGYIGDEAERFDLLLPKSAEELLDRSGLRERLLPEKTWSVEQALRLVPDKYTGANAVELNGGAAPGHNRRLH